MTQAHQGASPTMRTSGTSSNAVHALHGLTHLVDQLLDVRGRRLALVEDEIGVLLRDHRAPMPRALEAGRFDEPRGVIPRRIGEHRATAPLPQRLGLLAPLGQLAHHSGGGRVARPELHSAARNHSSFAGAATWR